VPKGWVLIKPGTFTMGAPVSESGRDADEEQHSVTVTRTYLMKATEVTQGEYEDLVGMNPSVILSCGADCPVENVSWFDAVEYVNELSRKEGLPTCYELDGRKVRFHGLDCRGYRLPTEAEWEYAARAGTDGAIYRGWFEILGANNAPALDALAWYGGNSGATYNGGVNCSKWPEPQRRSERCGPHPVGKKTANGWGLYDMLGNVWEWCHDWYAAYPDTAVRDPAGPSEGSVRVFRGGSWYDDARDVRAANRGRITASYRDRDLGFRPVRSVPGP
jgi:formylglycine-generating enzyme required for sulfatase activity